MNFKNEYEKAFSQIKVEDEFKAGLVKNLNAARKPVKQKYIFGGVAVAVATMLLAIVIGYASGILFDRKNIHKVSEEQSLAQNDIKTDEDIYFNPGMAAQQGEMDLLTELDVSGLSWYGAAENEEELLTIFLDLIGGIMLDSVWYSESPSSSEESLMREEEYLNLLKLLETAACTEYGFEGSPQYYKAIFQDGMIIKFQISDDGYLKIEDTDTVYTLQN